MHGAADSGPCARRNPDEVLCVTSALGAGADRIRSGVGHLLRTQHRETPLIATTEPIISPDVLQTTAQLQAN